MTGPPSLSPGENGAGPASGQRGFAGPGGRGQAVVRVTVSLAHKDLGPRALVTTNLEDSAPHK